jgi:hypothetical protein
MMNQPASGLAAARRRQNLKRKTGRRKCHFLAACVYQFSAARVSSPGGELASREKELMALVDGQRGSRARHRRRAHLRLSRLRFARNDETELPGFEQDAYAVHSGANRRTVESLLREFAAVRRSTVALFDSFDDEALARSGVADGKRSTVRALAYHIAGHELRHFNIIKERYL